MANTNENWMMEIFCKNVKKLVDLGMTEADAKQALKNIMSKAVDIAKTD